ncbi:MAG: nucleotidyltransferase [Candidatus Omnitrophica bacterium]|nr:nucleotidyltransferase [Candidatus Omnitrophota bacterium]
MKIFYGEVFKALNKAKVKYVVAGGVAVILYGYLRNTADLDLIVLLEKKNLEKFYKALQTIGYLPKVPVTVDQFSDTRQREQWKKEKGMIVFSFVDRQPPFQMVDMFVNEPIAFKELYKRKKDVRVKGVKIPLININHLLKLKKIAARDKDLNDIVQLEEIKRIENI